MPVVTPQILLRALPDLRFNGGVEASGGIDAAIRQRGDVQVVAAAIRHALTKRHDDAGSGFLGQFAGQRHGVSRASEKRCPFAFAGGWCLVGQDADGFAAFQCQ